MPVYDRALLLHGAKRDEVLSLAEVQQYGRDSFADPDYVRVYGMPPAQWYARGIRLLGRTAVECTRDALADLIGSDIATLRPDCRRRPASRSSIRSPGRATRSTGSCGMSATPRALPASLTRRSTI